MNKIQNLMEKLNCTYEEACQIMEDDKRIDKGEKLFELTDEQKKNAKKATSVGTRTVYKFDKRERKENLTKQAIIDTIFSGLEKNSELNVKNLEKLNKERQIAFQIGDNSFELTLVQKRKPKK